MLAAPLSGQAQKQAQRKLTINGFVHDAQTGEMPVSIEKVQLFHFSFSNIYSNFVMAIPETNYIV